MKENFHDLQNNEFIVAIHQPNYIPWLGYFYKISQSEIFVFLDDVQFSNKGMHNYTYIKTPQGSYRLKYPVQQSLGDKINEVRSKDELGWKERHLSIIESNYKRSNHFLQVFNDYSEILLKKYSNIASLNIALVQFFTDKLGIKTKCVKSSELKINGSREEKIISICSVLGGNVYYSGVGAKEYQREGHFNDAGIDLRYSVFKSFSYPQLWEGFQSNVTALDYFMNCGYDWNMVVKSQK